MKFLCMDAMKMKNLKFDVIIDKACFDATLCSSEKQPNPNSELVL